MLQWTHIKYAQGEEILKTPQYENVIDIEQYNKKNSEKAPRKKVIIKTFVSIILLLIGAYLIYLNRYNPIMGNLMSIFLKDSMLRKPSTITFDQGIQYEFKAYKNNILLCSRDGIKAIDKKGAEEWSIPLTFNKPLIQTTNKYILVANQGGREINVVTNYSIVSNVTTEEPIIMAKINDSGYFAVVTKEKGYKGKVTVFNPKGHELYRWHSVENSIIDIDISYDGKRIAVATVDTSKGKVSGGLVFFNLTEEKPYAGILIEDTLISNIKFYKDNSLVAIGDNQVISFSPQGVQKWNIDYAGRELQTFNIDSDEIIVLALSQKKGGNFLNNDSIVEILSRNGQKQGTYKASGEIKFLDVEDDLIALNKKRDVCIINPKGIEIAKATASKDIKDIDLFRNKREILMVSRNALDVLQLTKSR
ncbi:MAG: hypothetical protein PWQ70_2946 [Clostridiales bacterium]|nr:hypothetical protein [Clostridiales bacterium]